ncbi:MAG: type 4a pilus biogenesis protein PilO [Pseudomonadota bacterium]
MKKQQTTSFFDPFLDRISALSFGQRATVGLVVVVLLALGFYYFFYSPKLQELAQLNSEYDRLQGELDKARNEAKRLVQLKKDLEKAEIELKMVLQLLPDKKEIPQLLETITTAGKMVGLDFILFQPENETMKGFYAEIPITIKVLGTYHNVALFFDQISKLPRIVNIFDVAMDSQKNNETITLSTSCVAKTYRFIESGTPQK